MQFSLFHTSLYVDILLQDKKCLCLPGAHSSCGWCICPVNRPPFSPVFGLRGGETAINQISDEDFFSLSRYWLCRSADHRLLWFTVSAHRIPKPHLGISFSTMEDSRDPENNNYTINHPLPSYVLLFRHGSMSIKLNSNQTWTQRSLSWEQW